MKLTMSSLQKAVAEKIITAKQATALFDFLKHESPQEPEFNLTSVLYYLGGLVAIFAMSILMTLGFERYGGWGIVVICLLYAIIGLGLATMFEKKSYRIPAGICATFVIVLTPLAIYGLQVAMNWWPPDSVYRDYHAWIDWRWLYMELGTLAVGVIMAWIYRYPFMIMPIAVTLWYMSMDLSSMIAGQNADFELRAMVTLYFGLLMSLLAFWVDIRSRHTQDYAFWLYIFGVMTFWFGITSQSIDGELAKFLYFLTNILMIGIGVMLSRRVFVVFGALGAVLYLGYLSGTVFIGSYAFPFALTFIGFLIIYLGTLWQKNEARLTQRARSLLPKPWRELLENRENK